MTVLRLSQPQPQQAAGIPGVPGIPGLPIPQEWQQAGQQVLQGMGGMIPGLGGMIPGQQPQQQPAAQQFKGYTVGGAMPLADDRLKDEIIDVFGHESNFNANRGNCFTPGMGVVLQRPNAPPVELLVSFTCNQAMMDGARWPYQVNGFTPEARDRLSKVYEKLFGPVPAGS